MSSSALAQILWLFNDEVTEAGTMNIFFLWINKQGKKELVTAPLDGTILPGVTRDSILTLAKEWKVPRLLPTFPCSTCIRLTDGNHIFYS